MPQVFWNEGLVWSYTKDVTNEKAEIASGGKREVHWNLLSWHAIWKEKNVGKSYLVKEMYLYIGIMNKSLIEGGQ